MLDVSDVAAMDMASKTAPVMGNIQLGSINIIYSSDYMENESSTARSRTYFEQELVIKYVKSAQIVFDYVCI